MPEDSIILNPGAGGERIRTRSGLVNGIEVHEQAVYRPGEDTFYVYAEHGHGINTNPIALLNAATSGVFIQIRKLFVTNIATTTLQVMRFNIVRGTAMSGGTALTPVKADSLNANLPALVTSQRGATSLGTETFLFPWMSLSAPNPATQPLTNSFFQQSVNVLMEADTIQELTLQPGESFGVKQVSGAAFSATQLMGWTLVFTVTTL